MKCLKCGGNYIKKHGNLGLIDDYVGLYSVQNVHYLKCSACDDLLFPPDTIDKLDEERDRIMQSRIDSYPIESFISINEAASILGISRQAFHKNRRIRHGFIYSSILSDKRVYLKKSVLLFKKTGDGRFPLFIGAKKKKEFEYYLELIYEPIDLGIAYYEPIKWDTQSIWVSDSFASEDKITQQKGNLYARKK